MLRSDRKVFAQNDNDIQSAHCLRLNTLYNSVMTTFRLTSTHFRVIILLSPVSSSSAISITYFAVSPVYELSMKCVPILCYSSSLIIVIWFVVCECDCRTGNLGSFSSVNIGPKNWHVGPSNDPQYRFKHSANSHFNRSSKRQTLFKWPRSRRPPTKYARPSNDSNVDWPGHF